MSLKDIKVEIIRIIAIFMVLVYHTRHLPILEDGSVSETAVFIECMCTICVVSFFLISGFFIYRKKGVVVNDWFHVFISYIRTLCIPAFFVTLICIVFNDYFVSKYSFVECIKNFDVNNVLNVFIDGLKTFSVNKWPGTTAHLWYVFSYGLIVLFYPITRWFVKLDKRIVYGVLLILFGLQLYDDILVYFDKWSFNVFFDKVPRPVIYSAWGHMLYNDIAKKIRDVEAYEIDKNFLVEKSLLKRIILKINSFIIDKKMFIIAIFMYIISFGGIFFMQYMYNEYVKGIHTYTAWYSIGSLTLSMAIALIIMDIRWNEILNEKCKKIVFYLGGSALGIYLLHYPIVVKFSSLLVQNCIRDKLSLNFVTQMVYVVFYNLFIFICTLVVLMVVRCVKKSLLKICKISR